MKRTLRLVLALCLAVAGVCVTAQAPGANAPAAKDAALVVFRILQRQDWAGLYSVTAFSETVTDSLPASSAVFAADVTKGIEQEGNKGVVDRMFAGMADMAVGIPDVKGDYASLPTSCTITLEGKKIAFKGTIHLIRRQHAWKWDLTFTDKADDATSKALGELIGKPATTDGSAGK